MRALASALATPSRSSWWLLSPLKTLASCPVALAPPLSCTLRSSEAEHPGSRQWLWDLFAQLISASPTCQLLLHWLWINSAWQMNDSPLAFLVHLRSGPNFTSSVDPTLAWDLKTYLEISAGHSPAHTSRLSCQRCVVIDIVRGGWAQQRLL